MERELWPLLYRTLCAVAKDFSQKYVQMQPWILVAVLLWAALHDRPVSWACDPANWSTTRLRPWRLPSPATMSRRVHRAGTGLLWRALQQRLHAYGQDSLLSFLDGKPLPISGVSKDAGAGYGRAAGGKAKGYKLHTVWSSRPLPEAWEVAPMNTSEKVVARRLLPQLRYGGYLLADGNYHASPLYDLAWAQGYQLLAPYRKAKDPGSGGHYQSPHRLRSIALLQSAYGKEVYGIRGSIERSYGNATSFGGGLGPLPAWVRGLKRVRTWVWAKLLINAVRIIKNKHLRQPCKMLASEGGAGPLADQDVAKVVVSPWVARFS